ncbi:uncharacterized protein LOC106664344 [Cimex lectularius]|uniref:Separase n=1 Tax=Cimex lectularius TaxID=79782 RepID=A0A8I6RNQ8_CIMLE|nr:uncharacterized protein LOC106664344 [Cimex lectularius]
MLVQDVYTAIKADNVKRALETFKALKLTKENKFSTYFNVLKLLNEYIYKQAKENIVKKKGTQEVYELTKHCCDVLSTTWECKQLSFLQCLYHIHKFLIDDHPLQSKYLCEYFFKIKKDKQINKWEEKENLVISNVIHNFLSKMNELVLDSKSTFGDKENSLKSWILYVMELIDLQFYEKIFRLFTFLTMILPRLKNSLTQNEYLHFGTLTWNLLAEWFEKIAMEKSNFEITEKDFMAFTCLIDNYIASLGRDLIMQYSTEPLTKCIKSFKTIGKLYCDKLNIVEKVIKLCNEKDEVVIDSLLFDLVHLASEPWTEKDRYVLYIIIELISLHKQHLAKNSPAIKTRLAQVVKLSLALTNVRLENVSPKRAQNLSIVAACTGLYFVFSTDPSKELLLQIYDDVAHLFAIYTTIAKEIDTNSYLTYGVATANNTMTVYKKQNLFQQCAFLVRLIIRFYLNLSKQQAEEVSAFINVSLNILTWSFSFLNLCIDAQMALIAIASVHPKFSPFVFETWAGMKNSSSIKLDMESTVVTIINQHGENIEKSWPPFKVNKADLNTLLSWEIKAYCKFKMTHKEPVLAAYKIAAKFVKDEKTLAFILLCAVDSISCGEAVSNMINFEKSLYNFIQRLTKVVNGEDHSLVNVLLGNIHYQLVRCELLELRKKTEKEVVLLDDNMKADIPILQADQGDDLDNTTFAPAFSYLQLDAQADIFEKMDQAIAYWEISLDSLTNDIITSSTMRYIKAVGYLYRLYKFKEKELQIWQLLYKFASKLSSLKYKTIAISEMLALQISVKQTSIDKIKSELEKCSELTNKHYVWQLFHVNLARNAYNKGNEDLCLEILNNLDSNLIKYNFLVYVQYKILITMASRFTNNNEFQEPFVYSVVKLFENMLYLVKFGLWNSFNELCVLHWLLLETSYFLGSLYIHANYVRQARCYTKSQLTVAQRLALPLRVCDLLLVLGQVELKCGNTIECDLILKGIETILEFKQIDCEMEGQIRASSPRLTEKIHSNPHFLSSEFHHLCLYCNSIDYKTQALNAVTLRATHLVSKGFYRSAKAVFNIGHKIINYLDQKSTEPDELFSLLHISKVQFYSAFCWAYTIWEEYDNALKYNSICLEALLNANSECEDLRLSILSQKNSIIWKKEATGDRVEQVNPRRRFQNKPVGDKTPENPESFVNINRNTKTVKSFITPRPIRRKKLDMDSLDGDEFLTPFSSSDTQENEDGLVSKSKTLRPRQLISSQHEARPSQNRQNNFAVKANTEKKNLKVGLNQHGSSVKPAVAIKVYCDDDDNNKKVKTSKKLTAKKNILAVPSTSKKLAKKNTEYKHNSGARKLIFNVDDNNSDDDIELISVQRRVKPHENPKVLKFVDLTEDTVIEEKKNDSKSQSENNANQTKDSNQEGKNSLEEISIIERTPPKLTNKSRPKIILTPQIISDQFARLTVSTTKAKKAPGKSSERKPMSKMQSRRLF